MLKESELSHKSEKTTTTLQQTHTNTLSHSANTLFFVHSLDVVFALVNVFTLRLEQREMWKRGWGSWMFLFCFSSSFSLQHSTFSSFPSVLHLGHSLPFCPSLFLPLLIEAHGGTLVHAHVSVTEKSACIALDVFWVQRMEFLRSHFQVFPYFWTPRHLWDVKSILTACQKKKKKLESIWSLHLILKGIVQPKKM